MCSLEAAALGDLGDRADLVERVDRAEIGRLGQVDRGRLAAMQLAGLDAGERLGPAASASTRPCSPATGTSLSPPPKNPAALASEVLMCAASLQ